MKSILSIFILISFESCSPTIYLNVRNIDNNLDIKDVYGKYENKDHFGGNAFIFFKDGTYRMQGISCLGSQIQLGKYSIEGRTICIVSDSISIDYFRNENLSDDWILQTHTWENRILFQQFFWLRDTVYCMDSGGVLGIAYYSKLHSDP